MLDSPHLPFPGLPPSASKWLTDTNRSHIDAFSGFARAARDIADCTDLTPGDRLTRLEEMEKQLNGGATSTQATLAGSEVAVDHARHVVQACQKDVATKHYRSWSEFLTYCQFAAAPGGRLIFELHGQSGAALKSAEGLYSAWRTMAVILNCKHDYTEYGRIYLPAAWMRDGGVGEEALGEPSLMPQLRVVIDQMLDGTDRLLATARTQSIAITHRDLRLATRQSLAVAERLAGKLRRKDPLKGDISISRWDVLVGRMKGRRG